MKKRKEANWYKTKIGVGDFVKVKVKDIDEKTRELNSRSIRKKLVGLYYSSHVDSVLVLSQSLWLLYVFSMVYRW